MAVRLLEKIVFGRGLDGWKFEIYPDPVKDREIYEQGGRVAQQLKIEERSPADSYPR